MFVAAIAQFAVNILVLIWILKKKPGERFSKKTVVKSLLCGMLVLVVGFLLPLKKDTFFGMNPLLSGFLTAFLTAALMEEVLKYIFFRLAIFRNREVLCWRDAIIVCVMIAIGFSLVEDLEFAVTGDGDSILRALLPAHILFQFVMGYYYGKARVTKQVKYDVLSLAVPILMHTVFDMFLIAMISILGDSNKDAHASMETLQNLPNGNYLVPLLICTFVVIIITIVGLILMFRKMNRWSRNGEKQELLNPAE